MTNLTTTQQPPRRIIVLVSDQLPDPAGFARRIYQIAVRQQREVLYLALADRGGDALAGDRLMANLASLTQDSAVRTRALRMDAPGWVEAVRLVAQPGDRVICQIGQRVRDGLFSTVDLDCYLADRLNLPVTLLDDDPLPEVTGGRLHWWLKPLFWLLFLATLAGFAFLEVQIENSMAGAVKNLMMILTFGLELFILVNLVKITD